jgi:hypothetical protein
MIQLPRLSLSLFTLAFGFYHAILGFSYLGAYEDVGYAIMALSLYLVALVAAIASRPGLKMRTSIAWGALLVAVLVPLLMSAAISKDAAYGYTTWHVAGIATLMAILTVRQHAVLAWIGVMFLIIQTLIWGGSGALFTAGIFGAFLLVLAAQATSSLLSAAARSADEFLRKAIQTDAQTAANTAARVERQTRIQQTLNEALPLLEKIALKRGRLNKTEKFEARLTEHELRDQIRGRALMRDELIAQARAARVRGVEVQLLDDGGLEGASDEDVAALITRVAQELAKVESGKVVIRAVAGESWRLTMAAIRKGEDRPDLFLRL